MPGEVVTVTGWLWPSERPGLFSSPDAPAIRRFNTLNAQAIGAALGLSPVLPFVLVEQAAGPPAGFPFAATHLPRPSTPHLAIALGCFALALAALLAFAAAARRLIRPRPATAGLAAPPEGAFGNRTGRPGSPRWRRPWDGRTPRTARRAAGRGGPAAPARPTPDLPGTRG